MYLQILLSHLFLSGGWGISWNPLWMCGSGLIGANVGIVGLGSIGLAVAKRLLPFDVAKILYCGRNIKPEGKTWNWKFAIHYYCESPNIVRKYLKHNLFFLWIAVEVSGKHVPFEQLLRESDVVIVTCPLNDTTKNLFGPAQFAMMKSSAVLINTSRGGCLYIFLHLGQVFLCWITSVRDRSRGSRRSDWCSENKKDFSCGAGCDDTRTSAGEPRTDETQKLWYAIIRVFNQLSNLPM